MDIDCATKLSRASGKWHMGEKKVQYFHSSIMQMSVWRCVVSVTGGWKENWKRNKKVQGMKNFKKINSKFFLFKEAIYTTKKIF